MDSWRDLYYSLDVAVADFDFNQLTSNFAMHSYISDALDKNSSSSSHLAAYLNFFMECHEKENFPVKDWLNLIQSIQKLPSDERKELLQKAVQFVRAHPHLKKGLDLQESFYDIQVTSNDGQAVDMASCYAPYLLKDPRFIHKLQLLDYQHIDVIKHWMEHYTLYHQKLDAKDIDIVAEVAQSYPYFQKILNRHIESSDFKSVDDFYILWEWASKDSSTRDILFDQLTSRSDLCLQVADDLAKSEPLSLLSHRVTSYLIEKLIRLKSEEEQEGVIHDYSFQDLLYVIRNSVAIDIASPILSNIEDLRWILSRTEKLQYLLPLTKLPTQDLKKRIRLFSDQKVLSMLNDSIKGIAIDFEGLSSSFIESFFTNKKELESVHAVNMDDGLIAKHLPLSKLHELHIYHSNIKSLQILKDSHQLHTLTLHQCPHLDDWEGLNFAPVLQKLTIDSCPLFLDLVHLKNMQYLKELKIKNLNLRFDVKVPISTAQRLTVENCSKLESLSIFPAWKNLKELNLIDNDNLISIRDLKHMNWISKLRLTGSYHLKDFHYIAHLDDLKTLDLSRTQVTHLNFIQNLNHLATIDLIACSMLKRKEVDQLDPSITIQITNKNEPDPS